MKVSVKNKFSIEEKKKIKIKVEDVNENINELKEVVRGSVLENEKVGKKVMKVREIDDDGNEENNKVK
jgi:hypothetical protein